MSARGTVWEEYGFYAVFASRNLLLPLRCETKGQWCVLLDWLVVGACGWLLAHQ